LTPLEIGCHRQPSDAFGVLSLNGVDKNEEVCYTVSIVKEGILLTQYSLKGSKVEAKGKKVMKEKKGQKKDTAEKRQKKEGYQYLAELCVTMGFIFGA